jgi:hypothetical protein
VGSGVEQKIRQLGILVGSVRSPWLVVSMFRHGCFSNSLPLSFGDTRFKLNGLHVKFLPTLCQ